jgi:hypothetical protein
LGFESHREEEEEGTGKRFAPPQRGQCTCIYVVSENKLYYAKSRKVQRGETGCNRRGKYEGIVRPVTCCVAVCMNVELKSRVRGGSK